MRLCGCSVALDIKLFLHVLLLWARKSGNTRQHQIRIQLYAVTLRHRRTEVTSITIFTISPFHDQISPIVLPTYQLSPCLSLFLTLTRLYV